MYFRRRYPAIIFLLTCILTVIVAFQYLSRNNIPPLESNLIRLKDYMISGDVFIIDTNVGSDCGEPEDWDKFVRAYFPTGLTFIDESRVQGRRRIWYVTGKAQPQEELQKIVAEGRIPSQSVGAQECSFQLFEAPPDPEGILFDNGMRFHGMDVMDGTRPWSAPIARREGESILLRLWWSVDEIPNQNYDIGTYLMLKDLSTIFVKLEGLPHVIYPDQVSYETTKWKPKQYYIEERKLTLPYPTARQTLTIALNVYSPKTREYIHADGMNEKHLLVLEIMRVMAY